MNIKLLKGGHNNEKLFGGQEDPNKTFQGLSKDFQNQLIHLFATKLMEYITLRLNCVPKKGFGDGRFNMFQLKLKIWKSNWIISPRIMVKAIHLSNHRSNSGCCTGWTPVTNNCNSTHGLLGYPTISFKDNLPKHMSVLRNCEFITILNSWCLYL